MSTCCSEVLLIGNSRDLKELSLGGMLAPELGKLSHLKALILSKNHFSGVIPKEISSLQMLELLDLRENNLSGKIPAEMGNMLSLKHLLLCDNKFQGSLPTDFGKRYMLTEEQFTQGCTADVETGIDCINRKVGHWFKLGKQSLLGRGEECYEDLSSLQEPYLLQNIEHLPSPMRHRRLHESSNIQAVPASGVSPVEATNLPSFGSGSFPAIPDSKEKQSPTLTTPASTDSQTTPANNTQTSDTGSGKWRYVYVLPAGAAILSIAAVILCVYRRPGKAPVSPWKSGLSGQLQKAFVTGVPSLNRAELETACEDFSNIIDTYEDCTVFKGTLSSGVEISVASTIIKSADEWSKCSETHFRRKIDMLSRINHKNFVNLLGYCEENEPFLRMLVFEYCSCGSLYERLHAKEAEHLDWPSRVRIIMGLAYCLRYMHHELNPPVSHPCLMSKAVLLTDDNAAKIAEVGIWKELVEKGKLPDELDPEEIPPVDQENDVYNFGLVLLEIISAKLPYSEDQGSLVDLAIEYLKENRSLSYMIDPSLKSFKNNELEAICAVIQECIKEDPRQRLTMNEAVTKLKEVIPISPESATPRLSPLWWAELEILSVEAT
ncbi:hypothetical protein ACLOJK_008779 [Asimina triloba]